MYYVTSNDLRREPAIAGYDAQYYKIRSDAQDDKRQDRQVHKNPRTTRSTIVETEAAHSSARVQHDNKEFNQQQRNLI